jgi:UDP-N-acetylmuramoyl-L-alanyl-D-glutamate--2,6-diaminopimelate ligase
VKPGFLFVAVKGTQSDGHTYIEKSVASGAVAIVCEKLPDATAEKLPMLQ